MTVEVVVDPYGGLQESWPSDLLDVSSQRSNLVFVMKVERAMPRIDQITFPDAAHYELCGYDVCACAAVACGLVGDAVATLHELLADGRSLGYNPAGGANTTQLATLCDRRGWKVVQSDSPAGGLGVALLSRGMVGVAALNTRYGTGSAWNVLHPEATGNVGHYEGIGDVTGGYAMDATKEEGIAQKDAWTIFESVLGRVADPDGFAWALATARVNPVTLLWDVINGPEFKGNGGLLGHIARQDAQIAALTSELESLKSGLTVAVQQAGENAQNAHLAAVDQAVAALNQKFSGIAKAAGGQ